MNDKPLVQAEFPALPEASDPFRDNFSNPAQSTRVNPRTLASGTQRGTQGLGGNKMAVGSGGEGIKTYDDDDNISSFYGYIPDLSSVPVLIIAREGYDVFEDVLGISRPPE